MDSHRTNRHDQRGQSPPLAKPAAIAIGIVAIACAVMLMTGHSLPFQTAHAIAPGVDTAVRPPTPGTADSAIPATPRRLVESRPADYFPDQYQNGATKIEEPAPTF